MSDEEGWGAPEKRSGGLRQKLEGLDKKYGVFKIAKFAIASGTGFLVAEAIITLGVFHLYGRFTTPGDAYSSPTFVSIDVAALAIGVAVSFFLNEHFTVDVKQGGAQAATRSLPVRLLSFEGVNALGNLTIIVVQYVLLLTLSLTPVFGNIIGAIVSYPVTYVISMHFVWKSGTGPDESPDEGHKHHRKQDVKTHPPPPPVAAVVALVGLYAVSSILIKRRRRRLLAEVA